MAPTFAAILYQGPHKHPRNGFTGQDPPDSDFCSPRKSKSRKRASEAAFSRSMDTPEPVEEVAAERQASEGGRRWLEALSKSRPELCCHTIAVCCVVLVCRMSNVAKVHGALFS